jgi:quinol monooxygenase YgiN
VLESEETPGVLRTFTLWDAQADFDRYRASDEHVTLGTGIRDSGLRTAVRDGLTARFGASAGGPLLRVTRARFDAARVAEAAAYWRDTGGPMMRRAPGCRRADAFWAGETGTEFTLVAEWASTEDAQRFLASPDHKAFGAAMDALGSSVFERIVGDLIR